MATEMDRRLVPSGLSHIVTATRSYERWLRGQTEVVHSDLRAKHAAMAADPFSFLRASYYRWAHTWPRLDQENATAPVVLGVADLHVENFGTWRDADGRLVWGLNDFDECAPVPYTSDVVRLATSAILAAQINALGLRPRAMCRSIWEGYREGVNSPHGSWVLEERHAWLRAASLGCEREPRAFWDRVLKKAKDAGRIGAPARPLLRSALGPVESIRFVHRQAGLGSLGRPRLMALGLREGSPVAWEAKAILASAAARHELPTAQVRRIAGVLGRGRSDPSLMIRGRWLIRRISPHISRIELADLPRQRDEERLLFAMGVETGRFHASELRRAGLNRLLRDMARRSPRWLLRTARTLSDATRADRQSWRRHYRDTSPERD
jgi:hypothetical protein